MAELKFGPCDLAELKLGPTKALRFPGDVTRFAIDPRR